MTSILYPVAETAEAALHAPRGYAARAREAEALGGQVIFTTEVVGPAFATQEAAFAAYAGRPGAGAEIEPTQTRWRILVAVASDDGKPVRRPPVRPVLRKGRRWPEPTTHAPSLWRMAVSYWRIDAAAALPDEAARRLRRAQAGRELDAVALAALARQPLQAVRPQQPLDIGLFEVRLPEAPDTVVPDE